MAVKMIALDLDGTTLRGDKGISERTKEAIEGAAEKGAVVVIATGRVISTLPEAITEMNGISYYVNSNGAGVTDAKTGETLYSACVDPAAVEEAVSLIRDSGYMFESFTDGNAYIGKDFYDGIRENGCSYRSSAYVLETRTPVEDIYGFTLEHKDRIENMNVFFPDPDSKTAFGKVLAGIEGAALTSSFRSNYELGPLGVSKGNALRMIMEREGIRKDDLLAAGDSPNDIPMLDLAGVAVAVGNAEQEVKDAASYVAPSNEEDGVADAVERFVLRG